MGYSDEAEFEDDDEGEDEDGFDYHEFVEREFGTPLRSKDVPLHWQMVAIGLVLMFAFLTWLSFGLWTPF